MGIGGWVGGKLSKVARPSLLASGAWLRAKCTPFSFTRAGGVRAARLVCRRAQAPRAAGPLDCRGHPPAALRLAARPLQSYVRRRATRCGMRRQRASCACRSRVPRHQHLPSSAASGFSHPWPAAAKACLTAVLQQYARQQRLPLDALKFLVSSHCLDGWCEEPRCSWVYAQSLRGVRHHFNHAPHIPLTRISPNRWM